METWHSGLLEDHIPTSPALSPGLEVVRVCTLTACRLAVAGRRGGTWCRREPSGREKGAGAPPAAGALGRAEGASVDSSACSWGLHTDPLLRLSTSLSGWPLSPKYKVWPRAPPPSPDSQSFVLSSSDKKWPIV